MHHQQLEPSAEFISDLFLKYSSSRLFVLFTEGQCGEACSFINVRMEEKKTASVCRTVNVIKEEHTNHVSCSEKVTATLAPLAGGTQAQCHFEVSSVTC